MAMPPRLKFGVFMAPFHPLGDNPNLSYHRDLELMEWLDFLGYDEAWIGEHHSAGWETIPSPELFIAAAIERTKTLRLGSGVTSVPYHHPLMVANRYIQLDHHSRGRTMLGIGPGALTGDAYMMGIPPSLQRPRMQEAVEIIKRLWTETEPITYESDWFTLREARVHLRPYTYPHPEIAVAAVQSPSGMVTAGKHGLSVLSLNVVADRGKGPKSQKRTLADFWKMAEDTAEEHGQTMNRDNWRVVMHTHIAETKKEAMAQAREGAGAYQRDYFENTLGVPSPFPDVSKERLVDEMVDAGAWAVGTPDDLTEAVHRMDEQTGGFGGFLLQSTNWGTREQVRHSYELVARYVMPKFKGQLTGVEDSQKWYAESREFLNDLRVKSLDEAQEIYDKREAELGGKK
jgi:limonene 1,2-monooxygenase